MGFLGPARLAVPPSLGRAVPVFTGRIAPLHLGSNGGQALREAGIAPCIRQGHTDLPQPSPFDQGKGLALRQSDDVGWAQHRYLGDADPVLVPGAEVHAGLGVG